MGEMSVALPSEARNIRSRMRSADKISKLVVLTKEIDTMYEKELLITSSQKAVKSGMASAEQYTRSKSAAKSKLIQKMQPSDHHSKRSRP